ncbi:SDR family NAD(P)-dependent oxidoreductase [Streptomyces sp. NPDC101225]|uniref:SDR family NAD(P)-dependent oxidoreductase n=1 Tax=Streptomyces sp. NPDC101225 TaxID=3366135 RepID=UPI00382C2247
MQRARPGLLRFLDSFHDHAAFVLGRRGDVLATNHLCRGLIADFDALPYRERNLTRWIVLSPEARALYADWERLAAEMTAILRLDAGRHPDDARTTELVGERTMKSEHFRRWWDDHKVLTAHVTPVRADLAEANGIETVWKAVEETGRPLAVAVLNAGRSIGGPFLDTDLDDELSLIALNVTSVVHLAKHVARHMATHHAGRILVTSSLSATLPTPYETVYGPSRAFTRMFALGLREELKDHGVTVTTLMPGATDSNFHARAGMTNTAFGPGMKKNSRKEVARQGFLAMMEGRAEIVGGDAATKRTAIRHRFLPETYKAARHAEKAKPRPQH